MQSHTAGVNNNPVGKGDWTYVYVSSKLWDIEVMGEVIGILMESPNFKMKAIKWSDSV